MMAREQLTNTRNQRAKKYLFIKVVCKKNKFQVNTFLFLSSRRTKREQAKTKQHNKLGMKKKQPGMEIYRGIKAVDGCSLRRARRGESRTPTNASTLTASNFNIIKDI